jgi:outer membrane protein OmpA-like peptidoglycan-associated protein
LVSNGIEYQRLVAVGKGENEPIAMNLNPDGSDNPNGREKNRRTELKIMNNSDLGFYAQNKVEK